MATAKGLIVVLVGFLSMSETISTPTPGEDFYQYVNHKWLSDPNNKIPDEYTRWGGFTKLSDDVLKNLISLMNEISLKKSEELNEDEIKIVAVWKASMNRFKEWEEGKENYENLKNELNNFERTFSVENADDTQYATKLAEYIGYTQEFGISSFLSVDKGTDLQDSDSVKLDMAPTGLSLPTRDYYFDIKFEKNLNDFKNHLENIFNLMKQNGIQLNENFAEEVIAFEKKLAYIRMNSEQSRRYDEYFTKTTLSRFYENLNELNYTHSKDANYLEQERGFQLNNERESKLAGVFMEKIYEKLQLREVMAENYSKNYKNGEPISEEEKERVFAVIIYDGDYFRRLFPLIFDLSNKDQIRSFFHYRLIKDASDYSSKALNDEIFDFYSRKLRQQKQPKPNDKRSIMLINSLVGELFGKIYVSRYFPADSKIDVEKMIWNVIAIMKKSLESNDWLTQPTKTKAIEKLTKFTMKIGYPNVWKDYSKLILQEEQSLYEIYKTIQQFLFTTEFLRKINSRVDKNEWLMLPQTVNAYFNPTVNEIVFPAAILQPPFYHSTIDSVDFDYSEDFFPVSDEFNPLIPINLGGIGAVIAHEITHGYDDQGAKFDGDGNLTNWWTEEDTTLFCAKQNIMGAQTDYYQFTLGENVYKLNGKLTMGENLADLGGLSLGLQALKQYLAEKNYSECVVDRNYRLFFKSWANIWKEISTDENKKNQLISDPHAPVDFRGNMVRNFEEFFRVFGITENDKLYTPLEQRVIMW